MDTNEAIAQLKESCAANLNAYFGVNVSPDQIEEIDTNQGELEMLLGVCTIEARTYGFAMTLGLPSVISLSRETSKEGDLTSLFPFLGRGKVKKEKVGEVFIGDQISCLVSREGSGVTISRIRTER
jgi:hypothetical protein